RGSVLTSLAVVEHMLGRHDAATELLKNELEALDPAEAATPEAAELALQLAWDHLYANELKSAALRAHEARARAARCDDPALAAAAIGVYALTQSTLGNFEGATRAFDEAAALVSELTDESLATHLEATALLGYAAYNLDRLQDGGALVERGIAVSRA